MAGHYKIFLGMAAGVGKTFRMLQEGQAEAEAGRDVAIGLLETHGRDGHDGGGRGARADPAQARRVSRHDGSRSSISPACCGARPSCA